MPTHHSFEHANVSDALPAIFQAVLEEGAEVGSRQGERTRELLMPRIALWKPWQREVLVAGRKASIAAQIAETMWVLAGRNDVEWLSHYLPRAGDFSDDGTTWTGGYGPRIRGWKGGASVAIDQLAHVVDLLNNERGTRRAVINIYDPEIDWSGGKDVPCNNWLSFISRDGKLHMNVATRSNDVMWGWSGINQFEWSVLQEIIAHLTGNQIGTLTFNVTSLHVYEKHWEKANRISADYHSPYGDVKDSPKFTPEHRTVKHLDEVIEEWFSIELAIRNGEMVSGRVDSFPEPMMQSWLRVLQWYWTGETAHIAPLKGTRLYVATQYSPTPKNEGKPNAYIVVGAPGSGTNGHKVGDQVDVIPVHADLTQFHEDMVIRPVTVEDLDALENKVLKSPVIWSTRDKVAPLAWTTQFVEYVDNLHREKSAVYGDSWKRRGEQMAILANIARKVDRLGEGGAGDTAADTVIDLLVYLAKYALWLNERAGGVSPFAPDGENAQVRAILDVEDQRCVKVVQHASIPPRIVALKEFFNQLTIVVQDDPSRNNALEARMKIVDHMISLAFPTARYFWGVENGHILTREGALEAISSDLFRTPVTNETRRWAGYEVGENID